MAYQIFVSDDEINWIKVYETTSGNGGTEKQVLRDDGTVDYTIIRIRLVQMMSQDIN